MKKVSVIIPVYNVEDYLSDCICSVLHQTYQNVEIILVDDGSTDKSGILCNNYAEKHPHITVIHTANGGLSHARNTGLKAASGELISFVDSDDFIHPSFLSSLIHAMELFDVSVSECGFLQVFGWVTPLEVNTLTVQVSNDAGVIDGVLNWHNHYPMAWNKVYRREVLEGVCFPDGIINEDEFFFNQWIQNATHVACVSERLYYYRQRQSSIMNRPITKERLTVFRAYFERYILIEHKYSELRDKMLRFLYYQYIKYSDEINRKGDSALTAELNLKISGFYALFMDCKLLSGKEKNLLIRHFTESKPIYKKRVKNIKKRACVVAAVDLMEYQSNVFENYIEKLVGAGFTSEVELITLGTMGKYRNKRAPLTDTSEAFNVSYDFFKYIEKKAFDILLFFGDCHVAFHTIRAKRTGLAFADTDIILISRAYTQAQPQEWEADPLEAYKKAFMSKYCYKFADKTMRDIRDYTNKKAKKSVRHFHSLRNIDNTMPLVSICVPFYNDAQYFNESLTTLIANDYLNREIIVVDDGSKDTGSLNLLNRLKKEHPDVIFLRKENGGPASARNMAAAHANGEYLLFVDSDNLYTPAMISKMVRGMQTSGADCLTVHNTLFFENPFSAENTIYTPLGGCAELGIFANYFGDMNAIIRAEVFRKLGGLDEKLRQYEDWAFFAKLTLCGYDLDTIPEVLYSYRMKEDGVNGKADQYRGHQDIVSVYRMYGGDMMREMFARFCIPCYYQALGKREGFFQESFEHMRITIMEELHRAHLSAVNETQAAHEAAVDELGRAHQQAVDELLRAHQQAAIVLKNAHEEAENIMKHLNKRARGEPFTGYKDKIWRKLKTLMEFFKTLH